MKFMPFFRIVPFLFLVVARPVSAAPDKPVPTGEPTSYYKHIRPVFEARCQGCHQPAKARGDYVMTDVARLIAGGESGEAIVPGNPDKSYLMELITPENGKAEMPKKKDPLSSESIALIRRWITEGAVDDTPENVRQRYTKDNPPIYTRPPVITSLAYSPDGQWLAVAGFHEVLLHRADGSGLEARLVGMSERIESVAFSPDGKRLAVTGGRPARMGEVQVWDVESKKLKLSYPVTYDTVYGASWSPDGELIAFGCSDSTVRAIDAETGKQALFQSAPDDWVFDTVFSTKGTHLASVGRDMTAKLVEVATQRFVDNITSITPGALKGGIASVDRHPVRDEILVGGSDGVPKIYQMHRTTKRQIGDDANLLLELPALEGRVFAVDFNHDGSRVAAGSSLDGNGHIGLFELDPNQKPSDEIKKILVKPTHQRSGDETKKLTDYYRASVRDIARLDFPGNGIYTVAFSPDGDTLAAAGADGEVRLIDAANGSLKKSFLPVKIAKHKPGDVASLEVEPSEIHLDGQFDYRQLLITAVTKSGERSDVTRDVTFTTPECVKLNQRGLVTGTADGSGELQIRYLGVETSLPLTVTGTETEFQPDYVRNVMPVLSKLGCNQGTCHGAKDGKNGFKLSLRGYDPILDIRALTDDIGSRRVNVASPENSLILLKATAAVPHEGDQVTTVDSPYYKILRSWIGNGARLDIGSARVKSIAVTPQDPVVQRIGDTRQIRVVATYADGSEADVTREAFVESGNTEVATTDKTGLVTTIRRGEAPILARFEGAYAATTVTVMGDRSGFQWDDPPKNNTIDELVANKLQRLKILPSGLCTDAEFARRVYLDLVGLPPTTDQLNTFLNDKRPSRKKRDALIDSLIGNNEFVEHWTNKWADLLQVNRKFLGAEGSVAFRKWIRRHVADNTPYDKFVSEILTSSGSNKANPAASYFKILRSPTDMMENTTHLFLGVRFNCNKCHDHPFERWTQDNYYELSAYFARVGLKKDPESGDKTIGGTAVESRKPLYEIVYDKADGDITHERTGTVTAPGVPFGKTAAAKSESTRRQQLADWLTASDNQYFATSYVNRLWGYMLGTGLIQPLDDIRAGNPPSNPELLAYLTREFIESGMNTRHLLSLICKSRTYQLSVATNKWNEDDSLNFSHAKARRLPAEVLYDAIHTVTGSKSNIPGVAPGTRASSLPDSGVQTADGFLATFGRPARESACECERSSDIQLGPVMALVSGPTLGNAISDPNNAIATMVAREKDDRKLIDNLFQRILNRPASKDEIETVLSTWNEMKKEHEAVTAALAAREKELAPEKEKQARARQERIVAARTALSTFTRENATRLATANAAHLEKQKKREAAYLGYLATVPSRKKQWETSFASGSPWIPLAAESAKATNGATTEIMNDQSVFVSGKHGKGDYVVEGPVSGFLTGIRLEAMTDDRLPNKGPGRADNGNFVLNELEVYRGEKSDGDKWTRIALTNATATFNQKGHEIASAVDGKAPETGNGWAIHPETGKPHTATFQLKDPISLPPDARLRVVFKNQYTDGKHTLGRFRLSTTSRSGPIDIAPPDDIINILKIAATKRNDEQKKALDSFFEERDPMLGKLRKAWENSKKPAPEDPEAKKRREALVEASRPLPVDPLLARLQHDARLSAEQLKNHRLTGAQDLSWALINTPSFLFNR